MKLLLPRSVATELEDALRQVGRREIGGILMGEHVDLDTFRVRRITVQHNGGTFAAFLRLVEGFFGPLRDFFEATNHDYVKFNYLGEWHSHHSFSLSPSGRDNDSMFSILNEPDLGARFIVLMLVKLSETGELLHSLTLYEPGGRSASGEIIVER